MSTKKERGRFNIRLNENNQEHEAVIRLLEKQPPHGKAQFVVTAILDYMSRLATEESKEHIVPAMSRDEIEAVVLDVLRRQNVDRQGSIETQATHMSGMNPARTPSLKTVEASVSQTTVDQDTIALITGTLSAFRGG